MSRFDHNRRYERRAKEIRTFRFLRRLMPIIMTVLALVIGTTYAVSVMYTRFGSFTISVNKFHQLNYGLSLSEHADFNKTSASLICRASEEIDNIDGALLDNYDLGAIDGVDNGDNHLCYTFYCRNTGEETLSFQYSIIITQMSMDLEKAVRVRLITSTNGELKTTTDYARAKGVDEYGEVIPEVTKVTDDAGKVIEERQTTPFYSKTEVMVNNVTGFAPGDTTKYTVVIWLEGWDDDCIDEIKGGTFKIDMKFNVTAVAGETI